MIDIRLPKITGSSEREQLMQVKSYLYQLAEQLQFALNNMETATPQSVTSTTIIQSSGSSSANTRGITDFPIEEGTDGIWSYRKWHSGIAECWGLYQITGAAVTTPWGNLYETAINYQTSFPKGLFTGTPVAHYSAQTSNGGGCLAIEAVGETTKDYTCSLFPIRATPQTIDLTIAIRAIGRWK